MKRATLLFLAALAAGCGPGARDPAFDPTARVGEALTVCPSGATLPGIDVSHWDGTIDWGQVADAGQAFAFMKATEGVSFTDPAFATNWQQAGAAGVPRSAYHFFRASVDPTQQAQYFLGVIGPQASGDLPPMLDLETLDGQSGSVVGSTALTWLAYVKQQTGRAPIVYTSASFMSQLGNPAGFADYPLFVANWGVTCPNVPAPWSGWVFWQYTDSATVPGVPRPNATDADKFNGDAAALTALLDAGPPAATDAGSSTPDAGAVDGGSSSVDAGSSSGTTTGGTTTGTSTTTTGTSTTTTGGSTSTTTTGTSTGTSGTGATTGGTTSSGATSSSTGGAASSGGGAAHASSGAKAGGCGSTSGDGATSLFAIAALTLLWRRRALAR